MREGSLEAPVRHPLDWQSPWFWDEKALEKEMDRVFDICHGCRRCFNLCDSFPRLFDLIDNGPTGELDGVNKQDYASVEAACTLCDMCFMTKCPYVPPIYGGFFFPNIWVGHGGVRAGG
jgi:glycerol-3-phosphate dehydrogenase subunit C